MKGVNKKRNPIISLQFAFINAKDFFEMLRDMNAKTESMHNNPNIKDQEWKNFLTIRRALWIALVVEIGRLFDTYNKNGRRNISLKQTPPFSSELKKEIESIHGESIIGKIIKLKNSFTNHLSEDEKDFLSIKEICNSNLGDLLNKLDELINKYNYLLK